MIFTCNFCLDLHGVTIKLDFIATILVNTKEASMIVLLSGFMGAGKSSLLSKLRRNSSAADQFSLLDLDEEVERNCRKSISQLVEKNGWEYFRKIEKNLFYKLCNSRSNLVVALGGGTLDAVQIQNLRANNNIVIIWLNTPFNVCLARILSEKNNRPLAQEDAGMLERLYENRLKTYKQCDIGLNVEDQEKINGVDDILNLISNRLKTSNFVKCNYDLNL